MVKIWITKNGVIGTAHKNRKGEVVDFRPFSRIDVDKKEEVLIIYSPKGQEEMIDPLRIEIINFDIKEAKNFSSDEKIIWQRKHFYASYEGVEISFLGPDQSSWRSDAIRIESETAQKNERKKRILDEEKRKQFISDIVIGDEFIHNLSRSQISKIIGGTLQVEIVIRDFIESELGEKFPEINLSDSINYWAIENGVWNRRGDFESLREKIVAYNDQRREDRRRKWSVKELKSLFEF